MMTKRLSHTDNFDNPSADMGEINQALGDLWFPPSASEENDDVLPPPSG
jgi:hypothetical protein